MSVAFILLPGWWSACTRWQSAVNRTAWLSFSLSILAFSSSLYDLLYSLTLFTFCLFPYGSISSCCSEASFILSISIVFLFQEEEEYRRLLSVSRGWKMPGARHFHREWTQARLKGSTMPFYIHFFFLLWRCKGKEKSFSSSFKRWKGKKTFFFFQKEKKKEPRLLSLSALLRSGEIGKKWRRRKRKKRDKRRRRRRRRRRS